MSIKDECFEQAKIKYPQEFEIKIINKDTNRGGPSLLIKDERPGLRTFYTSKAFMAKWTPRVGDFLTIQESGGEYGIRRAEKQETSA